MILLLFLFLFQDIYYIFKNTIFIFQRIYYTKGLPAYNWEKVLNMPKFFVYGTYRLRMTGTTTANEEIMCFQLICDIKRPWEMP